MPPFLSQLTELCSPAQCTHEREANRAAGARDNNSWFFRDGVLMPHSPQIVTLTLHGAEITGH